MARLARLDTRPSACRPANQALWAFLCRLRRRKAHMDQFLNTINSLYRKYWRDIPWIKAGGLCAAIVAGVFILLNAVPPQYTPYLHNQHFQFLFTVVLFVGYFFIVALLLHEQLQTERKLRMAEAAFSYNNRGTLFNGTEPNIAFRIVTFNNVLSEIGNHMGPDKMPQALKSAGEKAASDFAARLGDIYENNIQQPRGGRHWDDLSFNAAIVAWLDYDSSTGWGILTGRIDNKTLRITVHHYQKLYDGTGGQYFGYFLAGYCQTVVTSILNRPSQGYKGCTTAVIRDSDIKFESGETVNLHYILQ
jgi:hypothetical protein